MSLHNKARTQMDHQRTSRAVNELGVSANTVSTVAIGAFTRAVQSAVATRHIACPVVGPCTPRARHAWQSDEDSHDNGRITRKKQTSYA